MKPEMEAKMNALPVVDAVAVPGMGDALRKTADGAADQELERLRLRMCEYSDPIVSAMERIRQSTRIAQGAVFTLIPLMHRGLTTYRARLARKRVPRYLAKGGVRR
jgi:hypothetical protein